MHVLPAFIRTKKTQMAVEKKSAKKKYISTKVLSTDENKLRDNQMLHVFLYFFFLPYLRF